MVQGVSPRVRGKLQAERLAQPPQRSIPACAGEAGASGRALAMMRVYPRVCGGSHMRHPRLHLYRGLSPRVRGKPADAAQESTSQRSIPACAGEAVGNRTSSANGRVYPRVCGGSFSFSGHRFPPQGLSPRVRGKPGLGLQLDEAARSIPACAGEASVGRCVACRCRVYPRVCGGSSGRGAIADDAEGLSPRVRGKLLLRRLDYPPRGSIPACAGEAPHLTHIAGLHKVYPRVCGGSCCSLCRVPMAIGLSPRVRGKQL